MTHMYFLCWHCSSTAAPYQHEAARNGKDLDAENVNNKKKTKQKKKNAINRISIIYGTTLSKGKLVKEYQKKYNPFLPVYDIFRE